MRAQLQTNRDVLKLAIIAHKEEWEELIDYLDESPVDNNVLTGFYSILKKVVIDGKPQWNERSDVETREAIE